jgi:hypothetical protein
MAAMDDYHILYFLDPRGHGCGRDCVLHLPDARARVSPAGVNLAGRQCPPSPAPCAAARILQPRLHRGRLRRVDQRRGAKSPFRGGLPAAGLATSASRRVWRVEDAEQLVTAWNERQAKRMPMLFSPTIGQEKIRAVEQRLMRLNPATKPRSTRLTGASFLPFWPV